MLIYTAIRCINSSYGKLPQHIRYDTKYYLSCIIFQWRATTAPGTWLSGFRLYLQHNWINYALWTIIVGFSMMIIFRIIFQGKNNQKGGQAALYLYIYFTFHQMYRIGFIMKTYRHCDNNAALFWENMATNNLKRSTMSIRMSILLFLRSKHVFKCPMALKF